MTVVASISMRTTSSRRRKRRRRRRLLYLPCILQLHYALRLPLVAPFSVANVSSVFCCLLRIFFTVSIVVVRPPWPHHQQQVWVQVEKEAPSILLSLQAAESLSTSDAVGNLVSPSPIPFVQPMHKLYRPTPTDKLATAGTPSADHSV